MSSLTRAEIGALGEQLAVEYLTTQGLRTISRNWRCRYGELDVIAVDVATNTAVFVEVKTRTGDGFGGLAEAVTAQKVRRKPHTSTLGALAHGVAVVSVTHSVSAATRSSMSGGNIPDPV